MRRFFLGISMIFASAAFAQDATQLRAEALRAYLGNPTGETQVIVSGRVTQYDNGAIYWSQRTGARFVTSEVLVKYRELGAESGALGFPVTDTRMMIEGDVLQTFEHGFITVSRTGEISAQVLDGATLTENSLTLSDQSPIVLSLDGGSLVLGNTNILAPQSVISCGCEKTPQPYAQRLGFCNAVISKDKKSATCKPVDCNGSCVFSSSSSDR